MSKEEKDSLAAVPGRLPSDLEITAARTLLEPWQWLTAPRFYGLENVPTRRPVLFAGNHTLMGVLDVPLMVLGLYERLGIRIRPLGDHFHFKIPVWRDLLSRFGTIDGTRENCRAVMRQGQSLLVFPGGGREVFKRRGEQYRLLWKNRMGFARLAIEHGYPIVPFAAVGAEECYDILADADDLEATPLGALLARFSPRPDTVPPLVGGLAMSPIPRPERFYFHFARPIHTRRYRGRTDDDEICMRVRERTRIAVEKGMAFLLEERERDPERHLPARLLHAVQRVLGGQERAEAGSGKSRKAAKKSPRR